MLSAVELIVTEFVVVAAICFLLLRYYAAAMVSTDIRFTVYLSWILGFIGILILPYDLSNAVVYDNHVNLLSGVWRFVYWSTFFLAWIVLPIQMEMHGSGKFSLKEKLWDAVYKLVVQGVLAVVASCCYVIYLVSSGHGTVSQVLGFTMAMGNTYGVLLLSLLMGNGLVAIPLSLWRLGDVEKGLQEIYLSAATIEEAFQDDKYELDDCENEVTRISDVLDKAGPNSILHSDIGAFVQLLKGKLTADRAPQRTSFHSYRVESISEFELVKKAYLTDLHKRLIIAQLKFKASQRRWIVLIDQYKKQQRIVSLNEDSADKSYHTYWERLIIHLTQKFYVHACRLLALLCGFVSALILWCELLMSSSWGSPIGMMMTVGGGEQSSSVTVQGISFIMLAYMSICTYWPLFRLNIGWKYKLEGPQQSSPFSLIFNGQYLSRLQFTIGYNFLLLLNVNSTNRTAFHELMKNSELIPVFGASFAIYIPLVMLLIALITLFDGYARIIKLLGVEMEDNVTSYKGFTLESLLWCLRRGGNQSPVESDPELEEKLRLGKIIIMKELKRLNEPVVEDLDFSDGLSTKTNTGSSSASVGSLKGSSKGLKEVLMKKYAPLQPDDDRFDDFPDQRIDSSFDEDSFSRREDLVNKSSFFKPGAVSGRGGDSSTFSPLFKPSSSRMTPDLFSISHESGEKATSYGGRYADV